MSAQPWKAPDILDSMLANLQRDPELGFSAFRAFAYAFHGDDARRPDVHAADARRSTSTARPRSCSTTPRRRRSSRACGAQSTRGARRVASIDRCDPAAFALRARRCRKRGPPWPDSRCPPRGVEALYTRDCTVESARVSCRIGAGYVGLTTAAVLRAPRSRRRAAPTSTPSASPGSKKGESPDPRGRPARAARGRARRAPA